MKFIGVFLLLLLSISSTLAQITWEKARDKDGIVIYTRTVGDKNLKEFKAHIYIEARISTVAAILTNAPNYHKWVYKVSSAKVLTGKVPQGSWSYYTVDMPWPLTDRDGISATTAQVSQNKVVITQLSAPDYIKEQEGFVRLRQVDTKWTIERLDSGKLKITYESLADPGGLPAWLVNIFLLDGPTETLKNLRKEVKKPAFVQAKLDWIKE